MNKKERRIILDVLDSICCATVNGDYPGAESNLVILSLCDLFDESTLLESITPEYHEALFAYGSLTKRAPDKGQPSRFQVII